MKNYEDAKGTYGYMSVCNRCKESKRTPCYVNLDKEVVGFPVMERCENCGMKEVIQYEDNAP